MNTYINDKAENMSFFSSIRWCVQKAAEVVEVVEGEKL